MPLLLSHYSSSKIVLANGEVLNVTSQSHPDLFWGMRGAGIGFGIITHFELNTFELGKIWGGTRTYAHEHETAAIDAMYKFVKEGLDPLAEAFLIVTDAARDGNSVYTVAISHSNPEEDPPIFDDFKRLVPLVSSTQIRTLKSFCDELDILNVPGFRYVNIRTPKKGIEG